MGLDPTGMFTYVEVLSVGANIAGRAYTAYDAAQRARGVYDQFQQGVSLWRIAMNVLLDVAMDRVGGKVFDRAFSGLRGVKAGFADGPSFRGPVRPPRNHMLGSNGTQVLSKTTWKGRIGRIDVENPAPGRRPGQIHYQDSAGNKYLYDPDAGIFTGAPPAVNNLLEDDGFRKGIEKGLMYLGEI